MKRYIIALLISIFSFLPIMDAQTSRCPAGTVEKPALSYIDQCNWAGALVL